MLAQKSRAIRYASRVLNPAERHYAITERECVAVVWSLQKFRIYFAEQPVKVNTYHSALMISLPASTFEVE